MVLMYFLCFLYYASGCFPGYLLVYHRYYYYLYPVHLNDNEIKEITNISDTFSITNKTLTIDSANLPKIDTLTATYVTTNTLDIKNQNSIDITIDGHTLTVNKRISSNQGISTNIAHTDSLVFKNSQPLTT